MEKQAKTLQLNITLHCSERSRYPCKITKNSVTKILSKFTHESHQKKFLRPIN